MPIKLKQFDHVVTVTRLANIQYFEFSKHFHGKPDIHPFRELVYIDNGDISVSSDHYSGQLTKNQLVIHQANEKHFLTCENAAPPNVIVIGFECDCPELDPFSYSPTVLTPSLKRQLTEVIKEYNSVFLPPYDIPYAEDMERRTSVPFGADQMIHLRLEMFLINLIREQLNNAHSSDVIRAESEYLQQIRRYIDENFCRNIRLEELCSLFNTNRTTLCNQFRDTYNITIVDYINTLRIRRAKLLLREGIKNVSQIAQELGFSSVHYFSQTFKKYEKLTPSEYRNTIKSRFENY